MPCVPSPRPAQAICRWTAGWAWDCFRTRRRATRDFTTTCRSSRCSPRKSSRASTAPAFTSCSLQASCTAMCEMAPMAYSRMFSLRMKSRAAPRRTGTASVWEKTSRLTSELARLEMAPSASLATLRSSCVLHLESVARTSWMTPLSPSCTLNSGSEARFPKTPHASLSNAVLSLKQRMAWMVSSMKPRFTMSSRYCALLLRPRTMPSAASWRPA
mmetsp:Transcript_24089/g.75780  ORF Transcript_24089/g.75780 Transcript_24089/m.75780 type:complete len:215 (+) Transcript_24089:417-1061(+)